MSRPITPNPNLNSNPYQLKLDSPTPAPALGHHSTGNNNGGGGGRGVDGAVYCAGSGDAVAHSHQSQPSIPIGGGAGHGNGTVQEGIGGVGVGVTVSNANATVNADESQMIESLLSNMSQSQSAESSSLTLPVGLGPSSSSASPFPTSSGTRNPNPYAITSPIISNTNETPSIPISNSPPRTRVGRRAGATSSETPDARGAGFSPIRRGEVDGGGIDEDAEWVPDGGDMDGYYDAEYDADYDVDVGDRDDDYDADPGGVDDIDVEQQLISPGRRNRTRSSTRGGRGTRGTPGKGTPSGRGGTRSGGGRASAAAGGGGATTEGDGESTIGGSGGGKKGGRTRSKNAYEKGTEEWARSRKDSHKEVERRRRSAINDGINELQRIVPGCDKNKGHIISRAVQYIQSLKSAEANNIEKWTLDKMLMDNTIDELHKQIDTLKSVLHSREGESSRGGSNPPDPSMILLKRENESLRKELEILRAARSSSQANNNNNNNFVTLSSPQDNTNLPPRPSGAMTGTGMMENAQNSNGGSAGLREKRAREEEQVAAVLGGNGTGSRAGASAVGSLGGGVNPDNKRIKVT